MSRVGLKPIPVPDKVEVHLAEGALTIKGAKGTLTTPLPRGIAAKVACGQDTVARGAEDGPTRALHGLARALAANAVLGVTTGFERRLEIVGVGFRAAVAGPKLTLNIGYSHPVQYAIPEGIAITIEETTK